MRGCLIDWDLEQNKSWMEYIKTKTNKIKVLDGIKAHSTDLSAASKQVVVQKDLGSLWWVSLG